MANWHLPLAITMSGCICYFVSHVSHQITYARTIERIAVLAHFDNLFSCILFGIRDPVQIFILPVTVSAFIVIRFAVLKSE